MFKTVRFLPPRRFMLAASGRRPAKDLKSIGITVGSLGNPFFVALVKGATDEATKINPKPPGHGCRRPTTT